jgi:starvation-inducible DNA-binding protein
MTIEAICNLNHHTFATVKDGQREWNYRVLQPILYDLIALGRVLKQLHWNVVGPGFRPIHLHLDEIYNLVENGADEVAERLTAVGHSPSGRICDVADQSEIEDVPAGFIRDCDVLRFAEHAVRRAVGFIRSRTAGIEDIDTATADMLHQIALGLDKHHWMLEAQRI